jgi:hypothetical protein
MNGRWESIRESVFGVFYILTEQNEHLQGVSTVRIVRRTMLYLLDMGQVLRAIFLPEFGWESGVVGSMNKLDVVNFVVELVCQTLHTSHA